MRTLGSGPLLDGDRVQLTDEKGKMYSFFLSSGSQWHSHKGWIDHDSIIGQDEGSIILSSSGTKYQVFRPLLNDYVLSMSRGATIVYPKDSALIIGFADIFPGAAVLEAGAGSGALSISLLRSIGKSGTLSSYEERDDFREIAQRNVSQYFGELPGNWRLRGGRVQEVPQEEKFDRIVLDMLAPWECIELFRNNLKPGGVLCCYVATTTQLSRTAELIRESGFLSEPESMEALIRPWHLEGLAVRPQHAMNAHTGFLLFARRYADGVEPLKRRRRPSKGMQSSENVTGE